MNNPIKSIDDIFEVKFVLKNGKSVTYRERGMMSFRRDMSALLNASQDHLVINDDDMLLPPSAHNIQSRPPLQQEATSLLVRAAPNSKYNTGIGVTYTPTQGSAMGSAAEMRAKRTDLVDL
jgi:hypothetical protein